ncbi:hypothetical protein J6590_044916, partial [Homalodisca vitripennis]
RVTTRAEPGPGPAAQTRPRPGSRSWCRVTLAECPRRITGSSTVDRSRLFGWMKRSCPCKQPACPANGGGGSEVAFKPLVSREMPISPSMPPTLPPANDPSRTFEELSVQNS